MVRYEGRQVFTGTISSGASFAYVQPAFNGGGVYEVDIHTTPKLMVKLLITFIMGGTLPSTRGVVILYTRMRGADTRWDEQKIWQTPTVASKTQAFKYYLDPTIWEYKLSRTGGTGQPFDLVIEEGIWTP